MSNDVTDVADVARRKRSRLEREQDLLFVAEKIQQGEKALAITEKLEAMRPYSVTVDMVRNDLVEIESRWVNTYIKGQTLAGLKAREIARIETLEQEAWGAWQRSKTVGQVEKFEVGGDGKPTLGKAVTAIKRDGEPKFLELMLKFSEHRAKLLGMFAPIKIDADVETNLKSQDELDSFRKAYAETLISQQRAELKNITPKT